MQVEISNLENNSNKTAEQQSLLEEKRKRLKELEEKEKELTKSLPLTTQITNLEREIKELTNKSTRNQTEEALLAAKKKQLEELLKKQDSSNTTAKPSDKTALYIGCGVIAVVLVGLVFILVGRNKKNSNKY